jgi:hypothetical protein
MTYFFALLFLASLIALPIVLIKPSLLFRKKNMSRKNAGLVVAILAFLFLILTGITAPFSNTEPTATDNTEETRQLETNTTKAQPTFSITKEEIKFGNRDIVSDYKRGFDYAEYNITALESIDKTITDYQPGQVMQVPFKDDVEIEIYFDSLDLKSAGLFGGGSDFVIIQDEREPSSKGGRPRQGKVQSWKIENNRAVAHFPPWASVPYGDGGTTKLVLNLETKSGQKFSREWIFQVGKNPAVYDTEF